MPVALLADCHFILCFPLSMQLPSEWTDQFASGIQAILMLLIPPHGTLFSSQAHL